MVEKLTDMQIGDEKVDTVENDQEKVGPYRLIKLLDSGSWGDVWIARSSDG